MKRTIRKRVVYPHPPERVWMALTTREALASWLMPNDFAPTIGHRFTFRTEPAPGFDGIVHCEVLELDAPRRMVWSWRGGNLDTRVSFELAPVAAGTELRLQHEGFTGVNGVLTSFILAAGFRKMLGKTLAELLARQARGAAIDSDEAHCHPPSRLGRAVANIATRVAARYAGWRNR